MNEQTAIDKFPLPAPHKRNWRDWQEAQQPFQSPDPRFELRLSTPEDFPEIYALLNNVFGGKRTIAELEWMYEKNPYGQAICELTIEKSSGLIISTNAHFPWPLRKGDADLEGKQAGDSATLSRMQRQGLQGLRGQFQKFHPWNDQKIVIGLPNAASRAAVKKYNRPDLLVDQIPFAKKIVDWQRFLSAKGVPDYLARLVAPLANTIGRTTHHKQRNLRIEPIHQFDQQHQTLSLNCSRSDGFWCPHGAQWMNWRYFDQPKKEYVAHGLYSGDELKAFSVMRLNGDNAMLLELISSCAQYSKVLLNEIEKIARDNGAITIDTYESRNWEQWSALKQQRYIMRPSNIYIQVRCADQDSLRPENWQFLPGDSDVF